MSNDKTVVTLPRKVGVCIPAHNCESTLDVAVQSALAQTHRAERILIVDDGSTDGTFEKALVYAEQGLAEVLRLGSVGDGRNCWRSKRAGFEQLGRLGCAYVHAIDADGDYVPPDYTEKLLAAIEGDRGAAVAYPALQRFGDWNDRVYQPPPHLHAEHLARTNFAPSTSLIRVDALEQIGGWPELRDEVCDDWAAWRRIRDYGWRFVPAETVYYWKRHANSASTLRQLHQFRWRATLDNEGLLTICVPFSGRDTARILLPALAAQTFTNCGFIAYDNSRREGFSRWLKRAVADLPFKHVSYHRDDVPCIPGSDRGPVKVGNDAAACGKVGGDGKRLHGGRINTRVAGAWNRLLRLATTDFVWCVEDDVIPPPHALDKLLDDFGPMTDAVSAAYPSRFTGQPVAWKYRSLAPLSAQNVQRSVGVEEIHGCGLGCVLARRSKLVEFPFRSLGGAAASHDWYDWNLWADVHRGGGRVQIDWDLICRHIGAAHQPCDAMEQAGPAAEVMAEYDACPGPY